MTEQRESLASRLGFILLSAGCAIGLGNVWRFPYITGKYGGALFVLVYLFFLIALGLPIMVMEFSIGRADKTLIELFAKQARDYRLCFFGKQEPVLPTQEMLDWEEKWRNVQKHGPKTKGSGIFSPIVNMQI